MRRRPRRRTTLGEHVDCIAAYRNSFESNDKGKFAPFGCPTARKKSKILLNGWERMRAGLDECYHFYFDFFFLGASDFMIYY